MHGLQRGEDRALDDLLSCGHHHLGDRAVTRRCERVLHLHGLEHEQRITSRDDLTSLHMHGLDQPRQRRLDAIASRRLVLVEPVQIGPLEEMRAAVGDDTDVTRIADDDRRLTSFLALDRQPRAVASDDAEIDRAGVARNREASRSADADFNADLHAVLRNRHGQARPSECAPPSEGLPGIF